MTQKIDYKGMMSQCLIKASKTQRDQRVVELHVKNYQSQEGDKKKKAVAQERSGFNLFGNILEDKPDSLEKYRLFFTAEARQAKRAVLEGKIQAEQKRVNLGHGSAENLARLKRRNLQMDRAWIFGNYLVVKCGCEIKYIKRETSVLGGYATESINFEITPGAEVWIENVFATGVEDLIQLFIIDDANNRLFVITWNLEHNREHSLFQSTYAPDVFPENLFMRGQAHMKQQDFNYIIDNGAIINLETNLPV